MTNSPHLDWQPDKNGLYRELSGVHIIEVPFEKSPQKYTKKLRNKRVKRGKK